MLENNKRHKIHNFLRQNVIDRQDNTFFTYNTGITENFYTFGHILESYELRDLNRTDYKGNVLFTSYTYIENQKILHSR